MKRPENEWIWVPVPALVTPEVWAEAQEVMRENKTKSLRNSKRQYLLTGLTICADCKPVAMSGTGRYHRKITRDGEKRWETTCYRCQNKTRPKHIIAALGCTCTMPQISSKRLDDLVWNTVITALLDRTRLEEGMERYFSRQKQETTKDELVFVQTQLTQLELEDEKLYQAYVAGAFEADEYAVKRRGLWERKKRLEDEKEKLQKRFAQQSSREEQKQQILASVDELRRRADEELPFELKRKILLRVVDKVIVNTREEWFELEGAISGKFDFIPACAVIMATRSASVRVPRRRWRAIRSA